MSTRSRGRRSTGSSRAITASVTIPVTIAEWPPGAPAPPATSITGEIFLLFQDGGVAALVARAPLVNGALRVNVPPIEPGLRWGVRLREAGSPGPVFRSGPLDRLPTGRVPPVGPPARGISVVRESFASDPFLLPANHLVDRVAVGLASVAGARPATVAVRGIFDGWEVAVFGRDYRFRQLFDLVPATDVGHPETVIEARPNGPGEMQVLAPLVRPGLREDVRASVRRSLERLLSAAVFILPDPPFTPTTYSVSYIRRSTPAGSLDWRVNSGHVNF